jgi:hypothetical protein
MHTGKKFDFDLPEEQWAVEREMLSYAGTKDYESRDVEWVPNEPFEDTLLFVEFGRGRSSAVAYWMSLRDGTFYPMFLMDLDAVLRSCGVSVGGVISGRFMARKQGANYGLLRVVE